MEPLEDFKKKESLIFCWGLAAEGQLGNNSTENSSIPLKSKTPPTKYVDISAGGQFSAAVTESGDLYMWGSNKKYQLALENSELKYDIPIKIKTLCKVAFVACGDWHTLILDKEGLAYGVGYNKTGCLGLGDSETRMSFTQIKNVKSKLKKIAAGRNISLFLTENNEILSCGIGFLNGNSAENINDVMVINELKNTQVTDFSAGFSFCACVDFSGNLYTWGHSEDYQLGHGNKISVVSPKMVSSLTKIRQVSCSRGDKHCHIGCVDEAGVAYSWGSGYKAKLGHGDTKDQTSPKAIEFFVKEKIKISSFISGGIHSACLADNGVLYSFGCGSDGRLGHPEKGNAKYLYKEKIPKPINGIIEFKVDKAFSSYYHMIALCSK